MTLMTANDEAGRHPWIAVFFGAFFFFGVMSSRPGALHFSDFPSRWTSDDEGSGRNLSTAAVTTLLLFIIMINYSCRGCVFLVLSWLLLLLLQPLAFKGVAKSGGKRWKREMSQRRSELRKSCFACACVVCGYRVRNSLKTGEEHTMETMPVRCGS